MKGGLLHRLGLSEGLMKEMELELSIIWNDLTEQRKGLCQEEKRQEYTG